MRSNKRFKIIIINSILILSIMIQVIMQVALADDEKESISTKKEETIKLREKEDFKVEVFYEYKEEENMVLVSVKSNRELKPKTLVGWVLRS